LVAWLEDARALRLRAITTEGAPSGQVGAIVIDDDERPDSIAPLGDDFVVTLVGASGGKRRVRTLLVRPDARVAGPLTVLESDGLELKWPRSESRGGRYAHIAGRRMESGASQEAVWVEVHALPDGKLVQDVKPIDPPMKTDNGEAGARVHGNGPLALVLPRSKVVVVGGKALKLKAPSLDALDGAHQSFVGQWVAGGTADLFGGPERHLRVVWFDGEKVRSADVRKDGALTHEKTQSPYVPVPDVPDEITLWGGGAGSMDGYSPAFSRRPTYLPEYKIANGVSVPDKRFRLPDVELDGGKRLPIQDGGEAWSGARIVYVYTEANELRVRAARCEARPM
jgi:hypothetical protein